MALVLSLLAFVAIDQLQGKRLLSRGGLAAGTDARIEIGMKEEQPNQPEQDAPATPQS